MTLEEAIRTEQLMYVRFCEEAARHDQFENYYKTTAHRIFYHIQEMTSMKEITPLSRFLSPIQ